MSETKITIAELELCMELNMSVSEIAKKYKCNKKTIYNKMHKIRKQRREDIESKVFADTIPRYFNVNVDDVMIINGMHQTVSYIGENFFTTIRANAVRESYLIKDFIFNLSNFLLNKEKIESRCDNCIHSKHGKCDLFKKHFYELYKEGVPCNNKQPITEDDIYGEDTFISYVERSNE